jgi:tetratricopeptide (TPR) repeat protein
MECVDRRINHLVRESLATMREVRWRRHLVKGWELLQECNASGEVTGPRPYTEAAIAEFQKAYSERPDDYHVLHHLAICYHALAWDMELRQHPEAAKNWRVAIDFWRRLVAHRVFWEEQKTKLKQYDPDVDEGVIRDIRERLMEDLLDIHVDFARHYCELDQPDRALVHVQLVQETRIPPVLKKRMVGKIFEVLTSQVDRGASERRDFKSGLFCVQRFLQIFGDQDYIPALRLYVELCAEYLRRLSYQDDWAETAALAEQGKPVVDRLARVCDVERHPLAHAALAELCERMAMRAYDRATSCLARCGEKAVGSAGHQEAQIAYQLGIDWARVGCTVHPNRSLLSDLLIACLGSHALCLADNAAHLLQSGAGGKGVASSALGLYRRAASDFSELLRHKPDDQIVRANLKTVEKNIKYIELLDSQDNFSLDFLDNLGDSP